LVLVASVKDVGTRGHNKYSTTNIKPGQDTNNNLCH